MSKIFVPFSDGVLDYDCRECGAKCCCEEGNIIVTKQEKSILLQECPSIGFFSAGERNGRYKFLRHPPCWFLDNDGGCEIQRKYGYSLKPFICRLHPFYVARCGDEYMIVHSGCERLGVAERGKRGCLSCNTVLANAREAIDSGWIREESGWPAERLDLEREILAESERLPNGAGYLDFAAFQIGVASHGNGLSVIRALLHQTVELWRSFLGIEDAVTEDRELASELSALTPLLRTSQPNLRKMEAHRVPKALLALYVCMLIFSEGRRMKRFVGTYSSVLADIPLGLIHLTEKDLAVKDQSLEKRLRYVRGLREICAPGFMKRVKPKQQQSGTEPIVC